MYLCIVVAHAWFCYSLLGHLPPKERVGLWESRRVFFLTPQVMQNDLSRGTCPAHDVCCVVFDEAHKALGNHAYCQVSEFLIPTIYLDVNAILIYIYVFAMYKVGCEGAG